MLAWCLLAAEASQALAEQDEDDVAKSGMGQGEARIAVRSDVRMSVHSRRGTERERVAALARVVGARMTTLRACYADVVSEHPEAQGRLRFVVHLPEKENAPAELDLEAGSSAHEALPDCVRRSFRGLAFDDVKRPASAWIMLEFTNTRARGQHAMEAGRRARVKDVPIQVLPNGGLQTTWKTRDGRLSFEIGVAEPEHEQSLLALRSAVQRGFAGLLDCRRHAGKRGRSPEGVIQADLRLRSGGRLAARVTESSVAYERTPHCVQRVLRKLRVPRSTPTTRGTMHIHFTK